MSILCSLPARRFAVLGLRRASAARRRLCRGRFRAARPHRGRAGAVHFRQARRPRPGRRDGCRDGGRRCRDRGGAGGSRAGGGAGATCQPADRQTARGDRRPRRHEAIRRGGGEREAPRAGASHRSPQARHRHAGRIRRGADGASKSPRRGSTRPKPISRSATFRLARRRSRPPRARSSRRARRSIRRAGGWPSARSRRRRRGASTT